MLSAVREARGRVLDAMIRHYGITRRRRWAWSPTWLRLWPFWESSRALRLRAVRTWLRARIAGTSAAICAAVADELRCSPESVRIDDVAHGEFTVTVPRRMKRREREAVAEAIEELRPACTKCVGIRER